jgi:arylsulfatase A-like enzyme
VRSNAGYVLPEANATLAEVLRDHGYATAAEIAAPVLGAATRLDQGFEHYRDLASPDVERIRTDMSVAGGSVRTVSLEERPAADITRFGKRFLSEHRDRPFFLWVHYFDPHRLYVPRPGYREQFGDAPYLAEVRYVDDQVGDLIDHLEELGLRERTLVVVVADHGEGLGEHDELSHSFYVYDTTQHVPLILWGPSRLPAGARIRAVVRTADVAPTILDFLGLPALPDVQGVSLLPLVAGDAQDLDLPAYGESVEIATLFGGSPVRYLRVGEWKYLHQVEPELYHVTRDPGETRNLAAERPEKVAALRERLASLLRAAPPAPGGAAVAVDADAAARLAQLGYLAADAAGGGAGDLDSLALRGPAPASVAADIERYAKGMGLAGEGFHAQAEPILAELAERHPDSGLIQQSLARSLAALGKREQARPVFERALRLLGCSTSVRRELATLLAQLGDRAGQVAVLREGVEGCPESYELLNDYAYALATAPVDELRDGAAAVMAARRALELRGEEDPTVLDTLAAAHAEAGDLGEAVRVEKRALRLAVQQGAPPELLQVMRQSLAAYREGRPMRVP